MVSREKYIQQFQKHHIYTLLNHNFFQCLFLFDSKPELTGVFAYVTISL